MAAEQDISEVFRAWVKEHRAELFIFFGCLLAFAAFSGTPRFFRQSAAPHFVYQAKAWLEGHSNIDPQVLPNLEDWACTRTVNGEIRRCEGQPLPSDRWYVSFPWFPAVVMFPFVAFQGYQFNDTSFGVLVGALAVALVYRLLRLLSERGDSQREPWENALLALTLAFGTLFFYCTLRGEVWFSAEVMGVAFTSLYLFFAVGARRPVLAGWVFSMAVLTRTPLFFTGIFFVMEALCPERGDRLLQLKKFWRTPGPGLLTLGRFALGALPLALTAALYNKARFGHFGEFGHAFLFNNRVNQDIDAYGLFSPQYLSRNLRAAFFLLPSVQTHPFRLGYNPHGLSLLLTSPFLVLLFFPRVRQRLQVPLWLTVAVCALPGLFYQNDGYIQFGFRFSLDYTPYLVLLLALSGWSLKSRWVGSLIAVGVLVNTWGAAAFRGYTEMMRNW